MIVNGWLDTFLVWRRRRISDVTFIYILSGVVGFLVGVAAVIIKNLVHFIQTVLTRGFSLESYNIYYLILPVIGILCTVLFTRYILRQEIGHGIPGVLFAISRTSGRIKSHNIFSSIIASALTVGFGGSVGLEGPSVATGAAIGSNLGRKLNLSYKQILTLLGCASAGAMSAIFKAPVAAIVFALEVIMLNLSMASLIPLLIASVTAALTSYAFLGQDVLYPVALKEAFVINDVPLYIILGLLTGFISVYFTKIYIIIAEKFSVVRGWVWRLMAGGALLGFIVFLLPALYGEGYSGINDALSGNYDYLFEGSLFFDIRHNPLTIIIVILLVILFKVVATSVTFGSGGVGGIFAPTLFVGAHAGLLFSFVIVYTGLDVGPTNFVLVGMAGMIAGVIHAPLTSIFLIAEITGGYSLFMPLMITSTISYTTVRLFVPNSVYTYQLAKRGDLFTHDKDKAALSLMDVESMIETDFSTIHPGANLGDLVEVISLSGRNVFPVTGEDNTFYGVIWVNDIRHIVFKPELYEKTSVRDLMFMPEPLVSPDESMEDVAFKFQTSDHYNLPVVKDGKYIGFVSRANVFSKYRTLIKDFMEE
jgi:CIC family chloride channel protein